MKEFTVVGVDEKEMSPFQELMMGGGSDKRQRFYPVAIVPVPPNHELDHHPFARELSMTSSQLGRLYDELGSIFPS